MKTDRRIIRTHQLIHQAFLQLLENKSYEKITIQDILNKAGINRTTFYRHYKSKQDVAAYLLMNFKEKVILPILEQRFNFSAREFVVGVSPIVALQRELWKSLSKIQTKEFNLYRDLHQLIKEAYIRFASHETDASLDRIDFQGHLYASLTVALLQYCIEHDREISEATYVDVLEMINLALK